MLAEEGIQPGFGLRIVESGIESGLQELGHVEGDVFVSTKAWAWAIAKPNRTAWPIRSSRS